MISYTDVFNRSVLICDQCRRDIPQEDKIFALSQGTAKEGYTSRNYDIPETVICQQCANTLSQVLAITGARYADSLTLRDAA